jgi:uncharacterized protein
VTTGNGTSAASNDENDDAKALEWLRANPDVIRRHPELLAHLEIPHVTGGPVSLIEQQVKVLRARNGALAMRLEQLLKNARDNEAIAQRLHKLALNLLSVDTATDILGLTYAALHDGFRAERTAVRLYCDAPASERGCGEFVGPEGETAPEIVRCLESGRASCELPRARTLALLFGESAHDVASVALVPVTGASLRGVLALASTDKDRFGVSAGTLFLGQLGDLLAHSLLRVLR